MACATPFDRGSAANLGLSRVSDDATPIATGQLRVAADAGNGDRHYVVLSRDP